MFNLKNHVAVITGATDGIGLGYAQGLAKQGASLSIWARNEVRLKETKKHLLTLGSKEVLIRVCDVADENQIKQSMKQTFVHFGKIDVCFANAGKAIQGSLLKAKIEDFRKVYAVNFEGMLFCFREASTYMIEKGNGGKLIATSSTAAIMGSPNLSAYTASKGAMNAAVRALAVELAPFNIQVNAIVPGVFKTGMTRKHESLLNGFLERIPSTFIGEPKHVEGIAVFLASQESNYITGANIPIDGGLSIVWD